LSPLTQWNWLVQFVPPEPAPACVLNIHSGFDDTTVRLGELLPQATVVAVDLYDPRRMTEPSIHRARRAMLPQTGTLAGAPDALPVDDGTAESAMLLLAAHELREPAEREALFAELRRVLRPGGRVILAEHARDAWNFLAFGPGFMHFLLYAEWLRLGRGADLRLVGEGRVTPFVRFLVFEK
jgi:SAM-dependent methyltransferase